MLANLPTISYSLDNPEKLVKDSRLISNVFRRISLNRGYSESRLNLIEKYHIKDGDTPESIANEKYENGSYWWVVLVVNPQFFSSSKWPMSHHQIQRYLDENYGKTQYDFIPSENDFDLPFRTVDGIVDHHTIVKLDSKPSPKTYADALIENNELARKINIVTPTLLYEFVRTWERASESSFLSERLT